MTLESLFVHRLARPTRTARGAAVLAAFAAAAGAMALSSAPAWGQGSGVLELDGNRLALTPREMNALGELRNAMASHGRAAQDKALPAARAVAQSPDALYLLALYQLEIGRQRGDDAMRAEALDILIPNKLTSRERLPGYLSVRGGLAFRAKDYATAKSLWTRLREIKPNDPDVLANLAQIREAEKDPAGAAELLQQAIAAREAPGRPAPELWYRQWLSVAFEGRLRQPGIAAAKALLGAYPSAKNWREAMVAYRQLVPPTGPLEIDLLRFMRAAGLLTRSDEYQRLAQLLEHAGLATEAKAVLEDGLRGPLSAAESLTRYIIAEVDRALPREQAPLAASQPPGGARPAGGASATPTLTMADSLAANGRTDEAIALYRTALAHGGADAAQANVRIGATLAAAGRRAEAEAAFRLAAAAPAQASGYPDLAAFWLAWLAHPPAPQAPALSPEDLRSGSLPLDAPPPPR